MKKLIFILLSIVLVNAANGQNTLDNIGLTASTPAASAYSLRKLSSSYGGNAILVRRSSDNATQDIGFSAGNLDTASLKTFVGSGNGFVSIWYDQSGNGRNLTQATTSRQSTIVSGGIIYRRNFKPTTYYDASDDGMLYSGSDYLTSNPMSINIVAGSNSSNAGTRRAVQGTNNWLIGPYSNQHSWYANGWNHQINTPWSQTLVEVFTVIQPSSGSCTSWRNGVSQTTANNNGVPNKIQTGVEGSYFEILDGYISEILAFNSALGTTDRQILEANQTTYYSSAVLSTDATLSALTTTAGTLTPSFASATTAYTATVTNATTSVTVTPTKNDANATIQVQVNGGGYATVASGAASSALSLNVGSNTIDVKVTAQDGSTIKTYTITVTRSAVIAAGGNITYTGSYTIHSFIATGAASFNPPVSGNIEVLVVAGGGAGGGTSGPTGGGHYNGGGGGAGGLLSSTTYAVTAGSAVAVTVGAGGASVTTGSGNSGSNSVFGTMTTTGGGGGGQYGAAGLSGGSGGGSGRDAGPGGTGAAGQGNNGGTGDSGGGGGAGAAGTAVGGGNGLSSSITGTATYYAGGGGGTGTGNPGGTGGLGGGGDGKNSYNFPLLVATSGTPNTGGGGGGAGVGNPTGSGGSGVVIVKYLTGTTTTSVDASGLTISSGAISPSFTTNTLAYTTGSVPNATSSVTVTLNVVDVTNTIQVKVNSGSYATVTNGAASSALALAVGSNTIYTKVGAADGTTKIYTITLTRAAAATDATLSALTTTAGAISPTFASATTAYTATVTNATTSVTVTPTKNDANATIQVRVNSASYTTVTSGSPSGALSLNVGSNTIDELVTAQDGTTTKTYTITVTRSANSTITNFSNISKIYYDVPFTLTAPTSNSTGSFTYTSSNPSVATISGNTVTIVAAGTTSITATQAADATFASNSITATLTVSSVTVVTKNGEISSTNTNYVNKNGSLSGSSGIDKNGQVITTRTAGDGLSSATASTSAYAIKQAYPSSADGLYWIANPNINGGTPFRIYADMTTDGGGWTLIMCNASNAGWNYSNTISLNTASPSISSNYSIIAYADYIKRSSSGFQYMIDAASRRSNGAIWTANASYSFVNSNNTQTNVTINTKFGTWSYNDAGIEQRMPWYSNCSGYITTSTDCSGGSWWGTLISQSGWSPAPWIANGCGIEGCAPNPGIIWYWVR